MIHTVKGFSVIDETEINVFQKFPCFLSSECWKYIFSSSSFSKPNVHIRKFLVHIMLKPSMKDFKHDLTSIEEECNCLMVNTFFGITLLGNWDEDIFGGEDWSVAFPAGSPCDSDGP